VTQGKKNKARKQEEKRKQATMLEGRGKWDKEFSFGNYGSGKGVEDKEGLVLPLKIWRPE